MSALVDLLGVLLALVVTGILFAAMAAGNYHTAECSTWEQTATGVVEWVCADGVR